MLAEKAALFQMNVCSSIQWCLHSGSSYHVCHCSWSTSLCKSYERFVLNFRSFKQDGIGSALLSGIGDLRVLLHEDISWFEGDCPQVGKPHKRIIRESSTFSHMVQRELSHLHVCLRDLKINENCYGEHARLTLA